MQETGVGCCSFFPGDLPDTGIEPRSPALQVYSLSSEPPGKPRENWEDRGDIIEIDSVGEGEGGKIWENGIETCKISCMK